MKRVLIIGAGSAIAEHTARQYAKEGAKIFLVARNQEQLNQISKDLTIRGADEVWTQSFLAEDFESHESLILEAKEKLSGLDITLIAHGVLPEQKSCEEDFLLAKKSIDINAISVVSLCTHLAKIMEHQGFGTLAVISSVAGDRGRASNYIYGSAKAMVNAYLSGLRQRLNAKNVHVLTIKPGFVNTPMTENIDNKEGFLWALPEEIAKGIQRAIEKKRSVVYLPFFWYIIMSIIKLLPEFIFKKIKF